MMLACGGGGGSSSSSIVVGLPVASVSEWGDDQSRRVAKVLVSVRQFRSDHTYYDVTSGPVVAQLTQPLKVIGTGHLLGHEVRHYVTS